MRKVAPRTSYEAKFSLQWCLAALLLDGRLDVDSFGSSQLERSDISELAARVMLRPVAVDVAAAAAPGRVTVTTTGGVELVGEVPASAGGSQRPLTDEQLEEKFHANVGGVRSGTGTLLTELYELADRPDLTRLFAAIASITEEKHR